jgi:radical SAM superfamily enzyme YgiQ (UPF0313 family)
MRVAFYTPAIPDGNTTPPLGPLYLLAALRAAGHEGRLFDARLDPRALEALLGYAPAAVCISAVTPAFPGALRAAAAVRARLPGAAVIVGGPHATALPGEVAREPLFDFALSGECELPLPRLCSLLERGERSADALATVANLHLRTPEGVQATPAAGYLASADLDRLPWPAFDLMDLPRYFAGSQAHGLFSRGRRILPVMTTRGCPQACTFCCRVLGNRIRERSVESVLAEVRHLAATYGIDELYLEDDNFTVKRERALEILDRLAAIDPPLWVKFANGIRADRVDRELLLAMKRARVYTLSFGIESGSPATLRRMRKNLDLEVARESVRLAKSLGFLVGANCIIGYPGDTEEEIRQSLDYFFALDLDSMAIVNLVPYPGTAVRALCEERGYLTPAAADWGNYYFSLNRPIPLVSTPELPPERLIALTRRAYRRMYLRPRWLWRATRRLTLRQMAQGARVMLGGGPGGRGDA